MKKLLSVVLALALCLTAMMGCFAVSAETVATKATINIAGGEAIKAGETATVTVTGSDFTDVCAADLVITLPAGFELVSVSEAGEVLVNDDNGVYYVYNETANTVKYIDVFNFNDEVKALDLALAVKAPDAAEDGTYEVTGAVVAANIDEEFLGVTVNSGAITVQNEVLPPEPVVDEKISLVRGISVTDTVGIAYIFVKNQFTAYDRVEIEIAQKKYDGNYDVVDAEIVKDTITFTSASSALYRFSGLQMYGLGLDITAKVNCYDADGNLVAVSNSFTDTCVSLIETQYNRSSTAADQKAMLLDLIYMAAEAEEYFAAKKAGSDLESAVRADANFTDESATVLDTSALNTTASTTYEEGTGYTSKTNPLIVAVSMAGSPSVSYILTTSNLDVSKLSMELSYHSNYFNGGSDVTETITGSQWKTSGSRSNASFGKTCLYDSNKTVTAKIYYDGKLIITNEYSVETYISGKTSDPLFVAIGKFGVSARAFFKTT